MSILKIKKDILLCHINVQLRVIIKVQAMENDSRGCRRETDQSVVLCWYVLQILKPKEAVTTKKLNIENNKIHQKLHSTQRLVNRMQQIIL